MLLQRLVADPDIGFNYDYMGSAEYEFGATRRGRMALAQIFVEDRMVARRVAFVEQFGFNTFDPIQVLALGSADMLDGLGDPMTIRAYKEAFRTRSPDIIGWMNVSQDRAVKPLLLVRLGADPGEAQDRIGKFLKDPIEALRNERSAAI